MPMRSNIGGQAVFEGVMMRSQKHMAVAVRTHKGKISVEYKPIKSITERYPVLKLPFLRGIVALYENTALGIRAMLGSANQAASEDEQLSKRELTITAIFATVTSVTLFVLIPLLVTKFVVKDTGFLFNLFDGFVRLAMFLAYLLFISFFKDVRRIFQYHGAEHMAVHAHEHGKKLTIRNVKPFTTLHPRCGTSFLLFVILLSVLFFSLIHADNFIEQFGIRIALVPFIAGVSYEMLRLGAKFPENPIIKALIFPGLMLQRITTLRPDNKQIEVAIASLKEVLKREH